MTSNTQNYDYEMDFLVVGGTSLSCGQCVPVLFHSKASTVFSKSRSASAQERSRARATGGDAPFSESAIHQFIRSL